MTEPVTLYEAKTHLRLEADSSLPVGFDDEYILSLITGARVWCEGYLGRSLVDKTIDYLIDDFGLCPIILPSAPIRSITYVKYIDENGTEQTLANTEYALFEHNERGYLTKAYGKTWPVVRIERNAVRIRYVAGYATPAEVPQPIKQGILMLIGDMYENRTGQTNNQLFMNKTAEYLLSPYEMWGGL